MNNRENYEERYILERQFDTGFRWFYWIAALSIFNCVAWRFNLEFNFIFGLALTQMIDVFNEYYMLFNSDVTLITNLFIAIFFILLGKYALKGKRAIAIIGMLLYTLDGLLFIFFDDWISVAFHGFALFSMYRGLKAHKLLKKNYLGESEEKSL